jgi:hypothetical protein
MAAWGSNGSNGNEMHIIFLYRLRLRRWAMWPMGLLFVNVTFIYINYMYLYYITNLKILYVSLWYIFVLSGRLNHKILFNNVQWIWGLFHKKTYAYDQNFQFIGKVCKTGHYVWNSLHYNFFYNDWLIDYLLFNVPNMETSPLPVKSCKI